MHSYSFLFRRAVFCGLFGVGYLFANNGWEYSGPIFFGGAIMALAAYELMLIAFEALFVVRNPKLERKPK